MKPDVLPGRPPRRTWLTLICVLVTGLPVGLAATGAAGAAGAASRETLAFRVTKVITVDERDTVYNNAVVVVSGGRIQAVGPAEAVPIPAGARIIDFPDGWLAPGMVDCHNHTAGGLGDLNDMVYQTNPGLNTRAAVEPNAELIKQARTGGVTTVLLIPGSGTNLSGFGTICKTAGDTFKEVVLRSPGSLKIAQSGNPEWYFGGNNRSFMNWNTRQTLLKAKAYHDRWEAWEAFQASGRPAGEAPPQPAYDPIFDDFRGLFRHDYPVTVHTQIYQVVMTTIDMMSVQLGLWTVMDHSEMDGWKTAPLVLDRPNFWTIQGPRSYHFDQTSRRMLGNANGWWKNGVTNLGLNTDAPVVPQQELFYQGAMGCWYGYLPYLALRSVTQIPAKALGLFDQLGSIEAGKDADFAIWTGDPIDPRSEVLMTLVNGRIAYDGTRPGRPRRF